MALSFFKVSAFHFVYIPIYAVGAEFSLGGAGYWRYGTDGQHWAVRALLLSHKAFLKAPCAGGAPFDYNTHPDVAKPFFLKKSEDQVKRAIPLRSIAAAYAGLSIKPNHGQHQI
jgi:hypothetical protein